MKDILEILYGVPETGATPDIIDDAIAEIIKLRTAIRETLEDNGHLADGENCTLIKLKKAIGAE